MNNFKHLADDEEMATLSSLCPVMPSSAQEGKSSANLKPHTVTALEQHLWIMDGVIECPISKEPCKPRRRRKKTKVGFADMKKRRLTSEQASFLEANFEKDQNLKPERKVRLASEIGLDPRQVAVWFQNRRVRWKNRQLEEEYQRMKGLYDEVKEEKCKLVSEVVRLKEMLADAENKVHSLSEKNRSLCSSFISFDAQHMFGMEFEVDLQDYVVFTPDNGSIFSYADWNYDAQYYGLL